MHLKAKRPIFVPREHWAEVEKLSKGDLMDMVWDYCRQLAGDDGALDEFRTRSGLIKHYRKDAKNGMPPLHEDGRPEWKTRAIRRDC